MKLILKFMLLFSLLASPLYFYNLELFFQTLYCIIFFSVLWVVIKLVSSLLLNLGVEPVFVVFASHIGLKFFISLLFISVMFFAGFFEGKIIALVFMLLYFVYTSLFLKYNTIK